MCWGDGGRHSARGIQHSVRSLSTATISRASIPSKHRLRWSFDISVLFDPDRQEPARHSKYDTRGQTEC